MEIAASLTMVVCELVFLFFWVFVQVCRIYLLWLLAYRYTLQVHRCHEGRFHFSEAIDPKLLFCQANTGFQLIGCKPELGFGGRCSAASDYTAHNHRVNMRGD